MKMAMKIFFGLVLELKVKNWALFQEYNYIKNQSYQKMALKKVALLRLYSSMKKKLRRNIGTHFLPEKLKGSES